MYSGKAGYLSTVFNYWDASQVLFWGRDVNSAGPADLSVRLSRAGGKNVEESLLRVLLNQYVTCAKTKYYNSSVHSDKAVITELSARNTAYLFKKLISGLNPAEMMNSMVVELVCGTKDQSKVVK